MATVIIILIVLVIIFILTSMDKKDSSKNSTEIIGICYKALRFEPLPNKMTEEVLYNTDRYAELFGQGNGRSYYPGFGRIFNRTFEVWYQEFGSQEKKGIMDYHDIGVSYLPPFFFEQHSEKIRFQNELVKTQEFKKLYNFRSPKSQKTWYAGLKHLEFTGITTCPKEDNQNLEIAPVNINHKVEENEVNLGEEENDDNCWNSVESLKRKVGHHTLFDDYGCALYSLIYLAACSGGRVVKKERDAIAKFIKSIPRFSKLEDYWIDDFLKDLYHPKKNEIMSWVKQEIEKGQDFSVIYETIKTLETMQKEENKEFLIFKEYIEMQAASQKPKGLKT